MTVQEPFIPVMESLCSCPVCYSKFNETTRIAQMLHCGHTFCSQCVKNVQKYGNRAHLKCPSCRAETNCDPDKVGTNFLVMEMIRKIGLMGPNEIAPAKRSRKEERERKIDEMIDESYRQLIVDVKSGLMVKFEEFRDGLRKSTIQSVQSELEILNECVLDAVSDACNKFTDSEGEDDDEQEEDITSILLESARDSDGSVMSIEVSSRNEGNIFQRAFDRLFRRRRNTPSSTSSVIIGRSSQRRIVISSSSSPSTSSGDESDDEENDGMDGMESESMESTSDDDEDDDDEEEEEEDV
ncbi:hypothetical protein B9Z55_000529 [Caenorhabditis nigoni]|uniref:RING-type domain-containing protein n=1 Tax=Caenorhabditis nigoni TaxID=1611254 RepID=A0A2G5VTX4_9PELO|nr:hypothetical protein B9Z55_000529 [Caenorhabditis nigoni]